MSHAFEMRVGMFIEFVAKPMPNVIAASTPRNSATNDSRRRCMSRLPENTKTPHNNVCDSTDNSNYGFTAMIQVNLFLLAFPVKKCSIFCTKVLLPTEPTSTLRLGGTSHTT